jgi:hypothetical protein
LDAAVQRLTDVLERKPSPGKAGDSTMKRILAQVNALRETVPRSRTRGRSPPACPKARRPRTPSAARPKKSRTRLARLSRRVP